MYIPTLCEDYIKSILTEYVKEGNVELIKHTLQLMEEYGYDFRIVKKED